MNTAQSDRNAIDYTRTYKTNNVDSWAEPYLIWEAKNIPKEYRYRSQPIDIPKGKKKNVDSWEEPYLTWEAKHFPKDIDILKGKK